MSKRARVLRVAAATIVWLVIAATPTARADQVTPSSKVTSAVNVYKSASMRARKLAKLPTGTRALLIGSSKAWHRVRLLDGTSGYVSRAWTTVLKDPSTADAVTYRRAPSVADFSSKPPVPGTFRVNLFDVGTGLAVLVQGADFTLLFDGGTNDGKENADRLMAYMFATVGPSGGAECVPAGDQWKASTASLRIDHVVLSHPHADHGNGLARILDCYAVANVWDSGAVNDTVFYSEFIEAVAAEIGATYRTASAVPANRSITVKGATTKIPATVGWNQFSEGNVVALGAGAKLTVLHAEGRTRSDLNENSVVLRLDLGPTSLLLTGDAGSGKRKDPSAAVGGVEAHLIGAQATLIDVDILQVGHHGSLTASRTEFLTAVSPAIALVSAGPRRYGKVVLPDDAVVAALETTGAAILRTDLHDARCPEIDRVGAERGPGGCDGYVLEIDRGPRP